MNNNEFFNAFDTLVSSSEMILDRSRGSAHPRYPDFIYPFDYGNLKGTRLGDGDGIAVGA